MKKALLLDLDNTIYPTDSMSDDVFKDLYPLIREKADLNDENFSKIKAD